MNKYVGIVSAICAAVLLSGCTGDSVYRRVQTIAGDYWVMGQACTFNMEVQDTMSLYDIYVDIRTSDSYPWSNIYMTGELRDSSSVVSRDTLEVVLFDPEGKATGHGLSNVKENEILWKKDYKFPRKGPYGFSVSHGMRNVELPGVSSVGVRIELAEKQP